jgi:hypothetical protein
MRGDLRKGYVADHWHQELPLDYSQDFSSSTSFELNCEINWTSSITCLRDDGYEAPDSIQHLTEQTDVAVIFWGLIWGENFCSSLSYRFPWEMFRLFSCETGILNGTQPLLSDPYLLIIYDHPLHQPNLNRAAEMVSLSNLIMNRFGKVNITKSYLNLQPY